jgi:hypothetical protein
LLEPRPQRGPLGHEAIDVEALHVGDRVPFRQGSAGRFEALSAGPTHDRHA